MEWALSHVHTTEPSQLQGSGVADHSSSDGGSSELHLLDACTGWELMGKSQYHKVLTNLPPGSCYIPGK